ncbi:MAG: ribosomal protein S18-alanine N-acetyltransferase [Gallionellaceae bacterium]|nr:ribosomal protein S18-alanine N-acetyltransferase [Gallionellaceae bacterium]
MSPALRPMNAADLDQVLRIENNVHAYPWTRGNFRDAMNSHYLCQVYEMDNEILGYAVLMLAVDEAQLLIIGIAAAYQRQGLGGRLLGEIMNAARRLNLQRIILEVRPSNVVALGLYRKSGFSELALRRDYYPSAAGREDAMVMEYLL